jgi:formylglycine-generating enzyme required for sulfatase activity
MDSPTPLAGHVFISYVHEDQPYTRKLADSLRQRGLEVWMDDRIESGDRWWKTIVHAIDASAAFVVVMTPDAEKSEWVEREVMVALDEGKPVFPLLLRGRRFPLLVTTQYADVTDGRMPPNEFYERLGQVVRTPSEDEIIAVAPSAPEPTVRKERAWRWSLLGLLALIGVVVVGVFVSGLIDGGEEPILIPTTSVPVAVEEPIPTPTTTATVSSAPTTETPTGRNGDWTVVVGSDTSLSDAEWEADKARQQGYNPAIYLRDNWYVTTAGPFPTKEEAESAKIAVQATIRESARVVNLNDWCTQPVESNGYFECDAEPGPSATTPAPAEDVQAMLTHTPQPSEAIDKSQPPPNASLHDTWTRLTDGMEMVYVPGGTFEMGSTDAEIDAAFEQCEQDLGSGECQRHWFEREAPAHSVTLDGFWIDQTEVTNSQYARCVADGTCSPPSESGSWTRDSYYGDSQFDDYPVLYVSWYDADTYCQWVGGRLPTEAEWEYAARGPDGHIYPWGNNEPNSTLANYDDNVGDTTKVGSYPDGECWVGALDMAGNVREWVNDWYADDYYAASPAENPTGPDTGGFRVLRGGSWGDFPYNVRSANRDRYFPYGRYVNFGFRCVVASTSSP